MQNNAKVWPGVTYMNSRTGIFDNQKMLGLGLMNEFSQVTRTLHNFIFGLNCHPFCHPFKHFKSNKEVYNSYWKTVLVCNHENILSESSTRD